MHVIQPLGFTCPQESLLNKCWRAFVRVTWLIHVIQPLRIHVAYTNESYPLSFSFPQHVWMSHLAHINEPWRIERAVVWCCSVLQCVAVCCSVLQCVAVCCSVLQCAVLRIWMSHGVQCVAVCCSVLRCVAVCCSVLQCFMFACEWAMAYIWMSRIARVNSSSRRYEWAVSAPSFLFSWDSFKSTTWLICMCDMTHSYVWHDSFICVTRLIHMYDMTHSYVWHDSFICVTWLMHMCDMTHSYVWQDSFICMTWLIHMCDMTHSYVWHDSLICVTWLIDMCDMTHSYVW